MRGFADTAVTCPELTGRPYEIRTVHLMEEAPGQTRPTGRSQLVRDDGARMEARKVIRTAVRCGVHSAWTGPLYVEEALRVELDAGATGVRGFSRYGHLAIASESCVFGSVTSVAATGPAEVCAPARCPYVARSPVWPLSIFARSWCRPRRAWLLTVPRGIPVRSAIWACVRSA